MGLNKIGALWRKDKNSRRYLSGQIELTVGQKLPIVVMPFERKDGKEISDKSPAYNVFLITDEQTKVGQKGSAPTNLPEL